MGPLLLYHMYGTYTTAHDWQVGCSARRVVMDHTQSERQAELLTIVLGKRAGAGIEPIEFCSHL